MHVDAATVCTLPFFLLAALAMSNRDLSGKLKFTVPFTMRLRFPSIRRFFFYDLLFSLVFFLAAILLSKVAVRPLFEAQQADRLGLSKHFYALSIVLSGFLWPSLSEFTIAIGTAGRGTALSLGRLRDYFLGGPMVDSINNHLRTEIEAYVDRVCAALADAPKTLERLLPETADLGAARTLLMGLAERDLESLYLRVSRLQMIPLVDRSKPLMRVADMRAQEEQAFYDARIWSIVHLALAKCPAPFARERFETLQLNARSLLRARVAAGAMWIVMISMFSSAATLYVRYSIEDYDRVGATNVSPAGNIYSR
jgi:hypothetical protein